MFRKMLATCLALVTLTAMFSGCSFGGKSVNDILSEDKSREIIQTRTLVTPDEPPALCINGVKAVYEKEKNQYFFTVTENETWESLVPTLEGYTVEYQSNFEKSKKSDTLKANRGVYLIAYNDTEYMKFCVMFTWLPVISVTTKTLPKEYVYHDADEEVDWEFDKHGDPIVYDPYAAPPDDEDAPIGVYDSFAEVTVLDAYASVHGYENGFTSMARTHLRGRSSRNYPKNSYKIELLKEENGTLVERNETLLGMRKDGDWNLNGMYAEPTKVRDKVASDVWLAITADRSTSGLSTGYRCEYAEVIINNRYHGLYLLTERIDRKQLGLQDGDYLYFSEGDVGKHFSQFLNLPLDDDDDTIAGYSLDFPKEMSPTVNEWAVFGELTKTIDALNPEKFAKVAPTMIDVNSLADYEIFIQAVAARDNLIQNTFYAARKQEDGSYKFEFLPWDLDQTFGNRWIGDQDPLLTGEDYYGMRDHDMRFWVSDKMKVKNTGGYNDVLKARYAQLRETVLTDEKLVQMVKDANAKIVNSGAYSRNKTRWPYGGYSIITDSLEDFIVDRMAYVDSLYKE